MSTGDIKNNLRKLQRMIDRIKYEEADYTALARGDAIAFLGIYHYLLMDFSCPVSTHISQSSLSNVEIFGKSDLKFMEAVYRIMRDLFSYKPPLTKEQFFSSGFGERKVIMCTEIIERVAKLHQKLAPKPVRITKSASTCQDSVNSPKKPTVQEVVPKKRYNSGKTSSRMDVSNCSSASSKLSTQKKSSSEMCLPQTTRAVVKEIPVSDVSESIPKPAPVSYDDSFKHPKVTTAPVVQKTAIVQKSKPNPVKTYVAAKGTAGIKLNINRGFDDHSNNFRMTDLANQMENVLARMTLLENKVAIIEQQLATTTAQPVQSMITPEKPVTPPKAIIKQAAPYAPETVPITPDNLLSPINVLPACTKRNSPEVTMINKDVDVDDHTSKSSSTPEHSLSDIAIANLDGQQKMQAWNILTLMKNTKEMLYGGKKEDRNNNDCNDKCENIISQDEPCAAVEEPVDEPEIDINGDLKIINAPF
ncbi:uncharacterized protein LOC141900072 isoform X2 [Tubulanus polymorphus]|uniref:uncharacterized protein LOC141900072 isoform X2 n=1 Tax=Tubulanus polymorphus TaxID=672921 RepID=UPI003DA313EC